tara:strand:- start:17397 stop:18041 length:645 start_codon:yes stop_codon:yes gene_type:complete
MNIFALSKCPTESAQQMIDKHVIKMPTESCQMLHTNALFMDFVDRYGYEPSLRRLKEYHEEEQSILMKPAMLNHPSTIWARQTDNNTMWLFQHALALCEEYTVRYGKVHGTYERILHTPIEYDADYKLATPPLIAMADEYRIPNTYGEHCWEFVIDSYRHYYLEGKWRFAEWKTERPIWWPVNHINMRWNAMFDRINKQNNLSLPLKMLPLVVE